MEAGRIGSVVPDIWVIMATFNGHCFVDQYRGNAAQKWHRSVTPRTVAHSAAAALYRKLSIELKGLARCWEVHGLNECAARARACADRRARHAKTVSVRSAPYRGRNRPVRRRRSGAADSLQACNCPRSLQVVL